MLQTMLHKIRIYGNTNYYPRITPLQRQRQRITSTSHPLFFSILGYNEAEKNYAQEKGYIQLSPKISKVESLFRYQFVSWPEYFWLDKKHVQYTNVILIE